MREAINAHQPALTGNVQKAEAMTDAQADLAAKVAIDAHQLAHTANVQKAEAMTGAQADIAAKVAINAHQPAVEATIEEAALIEKKKTNANQHVQPENLVVLTW
jgi:hypothetical protein